jgi:hypothetical protein
MTKRRQLDRERLEIYYLQLLLAFRPFIQISCLLLLVYSIPALLLSPQVGTVALGLAIFLVVITTSDQAALYLAKLGAWMGTVWKKDD